MTKPLFQRRHYEFLAKELSFTTQHGLTAKQLALALQKDNPQFNFEKFMKVVNHG